MVSMLTDDDIYKNSLQSSREVIGIDGDLGEILALLFHTGGYGNTIVIPDRNKILDMDLALKYGIVTNKYYNMNGEVEPENLVLFIDSLDNFGTRVRTMIDTLERNYNFIYVLNKEKPNIVKAYTVGDELSTLLDSKGFHILNTNLPKIISSTYDDLKSIEHKYNDVVLDLSKEMQKFMASKYRDVKAKTSDGKSLILDIFSKALEYKKKYKDEFSIILFERDIPLSREVHAKYRESIIEIASVMIFHYKLKVLLPTELSRAVFENLVYSYNILNIHSDYSKSYVTLQDKLEAIYNISPMGIETDLRYRGTFIFYRAYKRPTISLNLRKYDIEGRLEGTIPEVLYGFDYPYIQPIVSSVKEYKGKCLRDDIIDIREMYKEWTDSNFKKNSEIFDKLYRSGFYLDLSTDLVTCENGKYYIYRVVNNETLSVSFERNTYTMIGASLSKKSVTKVSSTFSNFLPSTAFYDSPIRPVVIDKLVEDFNAMLLDNPQATLISLAQGSKESFNLFIEILNLMKACHINPMPTEYNATKKKLFTNRLFKSKELQSKIRELYNTDFSYINDLNFNNKYIKVQDTPGQGVEYLEMKTFTQVHGGVLAMRGNVDVSEQLELCPTDLVFYSKDFNRFRDIIKEDIKEKMNIVLDYKLSFFGLPEFHVLNNKLVSSYLK